MFRLPPLEEKDDKEDRKKLAPIAEGHYLDKSVDRNSSTVATAPNINKTVQNGCRYSVFLDPVQLKYDTPCDNTRPITAKVIIRQFPVSEADKRSKIRPTDPMEIVVTTR